MKRIPSIFLAIAFLISLVQLDIQAQMTPWEANAKMTKGINMGRSLELAYEGEAGGRLITTQFLDDFKSAGFNFIRFPIQWNGHTATTAPYTIDEAWLNRVEQVIDWALERKFMLIINAHHDRWILENASYTNDDFLRFTSIWTQVADRFKDKSDSVLFEIANEPMALSLTQINKINSAVIDSIRLTNPTRIIIYSGNSYTGLTNMKNATRPNDPNMMATFHSYDPWPFAGDGIGTWGTTAEKKAVADMFKSAKTWSDLYNIPVLLGEYGTVNKCEAESRRKWLNTYVEEARRNNVSPCVWHDFGDFGIYKHYMAVGSRWDILKDIVVYSHPESANNLTFEFKNQGTNTYVNWSNRTTGQLSIKIQRGTTVENMTTIGTLYGDSTSFLDANTILNKTYYYRIVSELANGEIVYSLPIAVKTATTTGLGDDLTTSKPNAVDVFRVDDNLSIEVSTEFELQNKYYKLYALSGALITSGMFNNNKKELNISDVNSGIFLVHVSTDTDILGVVKMVK